MRGEELSQCGYFLDKKGRDQFFTILCGRLLWTPPSGLEAQCWIFLNKINALLDN